MRDASDRMLDAALMQVPFDGWSETAFRAAATEAGLSEAEARALFPRGAPDMAMAFHRRCDRALAAALAAADLGAMRFRDRVAHAVRLRLDLVEDHRESVRRGATLFALPIHAADGARLIWETADTIWTGLGDRSEDLNWYTKRAILAGVYSATLLYWLGDQSPGSAASWAFLDRRIGEVMRFEAAKAQARGNPVLKPLVAGLDRLAARVRAPARPARPAPADLPGRWPPAE